MALPPRSQLLKDPMDRRPWAAWCTLLLGAALVFYPFAAFGYLVTLLPWCLLAVCVIQAFRAWRKKTAPGSRSGGPLHGVWRWSGAGFFLILTLALFLRPAWCDVVLWYCFAAWVVLTALWTLIPAFRTGVERQFLWRLTGSAAALLFAALMLLRPRSGLSDALRLLGFFAVAWGVFQLAIPRHKE